MVAIYIPVLQSPESVYNYIAKTYKSDYKKAFILRALYACNEAKDNHITCLGTAFTYNRRCRNSLGRWTGVLAQMIDAAEDGTLGFEDLKIIAPVWADRLSCYLHGKQKSVTMAVLGAIAAYRQTFPANVVVPRVQRFGSMLDFVSGAVDSHAVTSLTCETGCKTPESVAKQHDGSWASLGGSIQQVNAERLVELQRLKMALVSIEKAILLLCENIMFLLEEQGLLQEVASLLAEEQKLLCLCEK